MDVATDVSHWLVNAYILILKKNEVKQSNKLIV